MRLRPAGVLVLLFLAALAPPVRAGVPSSSQTNGLVRSVDDGGGDHWAWSGSYRLGVALGEAVVGSSSTSTSYAFAPGALNIFSLPGPLTNLSGLPDVTISSVTLQWTAPGQDGDQAPLQADSTYYIRVASYTAPDDFLFSHADVAVSTQGVPSGALVSTRIAGLLPNTTYFAHVWTADWTGNLSFKSLRSTFTTLALPPPMLADTFTGIFDTSMTVSWAALPLAPPDASSRTAEGYVLEASSTNFGALTPGGVVYSSATMQVLASTLTVGVAVPLDYCTTYYFRLGSLNWIGATNYVVLSATRPLVDYGVYLSTHDLNVGNVDVRTELYISTSFVLYNTGTCAVTFQLKAADVTPGTPWLISVSSGTDRFTLQAGFNPTKPTIDDFGEEDKMMDTFADSTLARFAIGQDGVAVPRGQYRLLWFKLGMPKITSVDDPQTIRVTAQAAAP